VIPVIVATRGERGGDDRTASIRGIEARIIMHWMRCKGQAEDPFVLQSILSPPNDPKIA
jgi:hypothetical protein